MGLGSGLGSPLALTLNPDLLEEEDAQEERVSPAEAHLSELEDGDGGVQHGHGHLAGVGVGVRVRVRV